MGGYVDKNNEIEGGGGGGGGGGGVPPWKIKINYKYQRVTLFP